MSLMGNEIVQDDLSNKLTDVLPACGIEIPEGEVAVVVVKDWIGDADGLRLEVRIPTDSSGAIGLLELLDWARQDKIRRGKREPR